MDCEPVKQLDVNSSSLLPASPGNGRAAVEPAASMAVIDRPLPIWRLILLLAWPVLAQSTLNFAVTVSDRFLVGWLPFGTADQQVEYQAAQTLALYISWFLSSYGLLVSVGSTALVARFIGARDQAGAVQATNQSIVLAVFLGLVGSAVGFLGLDRLVELLQLHGEAADFAKIYLRPFLWLLVFQVIEMAGIGCLVGVGDTRPCLWVLGTVAVINLPLAWGLAQGFGPVPRLGFQGVAVGTAISSSLGGLTILILLIRGRSGLKLHRRLLWPNWNLLGRLLRISGPAGIDSLPWRSASSVFWPSSIA